MFWRFVLTAPTKNKKGSGSSSMTKAINKNIEVLSFERASNVGSPLLVVKPGKQDTVKERRMLLNRAIGNRKKRAVVSKHEQHIADLKREIAKMK